MDGIKRSIVSCLMNKDHVSPILVHLGSKTSERICCIPIKWAEKTNLDCAMKYEQEVVP